MFILKLETAVKNFQSNVLQSEDIITWSCNDTVQRTKNIVNTTRKETKLLSISGYETNDDQILMKCLIKNYFKRQLRALSAVKKLQVNLK